MRKKSKTLRNRDKPLRKKNKIDKWWVCGICKKNSRLLCPIWVHKGEFKKQYPKKNAFDLPEEFKCETIKLEEERGANRKLEEYEKKCEECSKKLTCNKLLKACTNCWEGEESYKPGSAEQAFILSIRKSHSNFIELFASNS